MTTKREIVLDAYSEVGIAEYNFDLSPEELNTARKRLDRMMAQWETKVAMGYFMPANPNDSDLDDESGLPDGAVLAASLNLAVQLAPGLGKTVTMQTMIAAKNAYNSVLAQFSQIPRLRYPNNLPVGSGNKPLPNMDGFFNPNQQITTSQNGPTWDDSEGIPFSTT